MATNNTNNQANIPEESFLDASITGQATPTQQETQVETPPTQVTPEVTPTPTQIVEPTQDNIITNQMVDAGTLPETQRENIPQQTQQTQVVETPVIETPSTETKQTTPAQKIETTQDVKGQEIQNTQADDQLKAQQKQTAVTEFQNLVSGGADVQTLANYVNKNPDYRDDYNVILKNQIKSKNNTDFYRKYAGMSNEAMLQATKTGELVIGSEKYNLLPEAQRQAFESYKQQTEAPTITSKTSFEDYINITNNTELNNLKNEITSFNIRKEADKLMNTNAMNTTLTKLTQQKVKIEELDIELEDIADRVSEQYAGNLPAVVNGAVRDATNDLIKQKRLALAEYNAYLGQYNTLQSNAKDELELLMYEDTRNRELYNEKLSQYETYRQEKRQEELLQAQGEQALLQDQANFERELFMKELEMENERIATEKALSNEKDLLTYKYTLEQNNVKGKWEERYDGLYFLTDDGYAEKVINGGAEYNSDGTVTYSYLDEDGNPHFETRDINGNTIGASVTAKVNQAQADLLNAPAGTIIPSRLSETTNPNGGKECAEYINDIFGTTMGDTIQSKLAVAVEKEGNLGSIAVWNPKPNDPKWSKYGHAGVIIDEDGDNWIIKSSNFNGDGTISVDRVPKSAIQGYKNTDLFTEEPIYGDAQEQFLATVDITKFDTNARKTMEGLGLSEEDVYAYKAQNMDASKKQKVQAIYDALQELKGDDGTFESAEGYSGAVGRAKSKIPFASDLIPGSKAADYKNKANQVINSLVLDNLDLMSGVLTDSDVAILKSAATELNIDTSSEEGFAEGLRQLEEKYKNALGIKSPFFTDEDGVNYTQDELITELERQVNEGLATPEQVDAWIKQNNLVFN